MGYTKFITSGDILEIYEYEKDLPERRKSLKKRSSVRIRAFTRRTDNVERLKRNFIRLVRSNLGGTESPLFFTFTMVEVVRIEIAYRIFTRFVQRVRRIYGSHSRYIAVPEFQKRGAVHFHVLWWGFPQEVVLNETRNRTIQHLWQRGFIDCFRTDGSPKLASYVAKYMHKALFDDRLYSQKAYVCSRNVLRPVLLPTSSAFGVSSELWGLDLSPELSPPLREKVFMTKWLGKGRYRMFNIKKDENNHNE